MSYSEQSQKIIITEFENREQFFLALKNNPGIIVVKFGAEWCGPCARIHDLVYENFSKMPEQALCADIDVDNNDDLYSFFVSKRMLNGIPAILTYKKGNESYVPDDMVVGADNYRVNSFFERCLDML